jgi:hypothetical protein
MSSDTAIDPPRNVKPPILESSIEAYLVKAWEMLGGKTYKWSSPGYAGVPDRLLFHPRMWGQVVAVEVKAPGKKPTEKQAKVLLDLERMGVYACCVDSKGAVDSLLGRLVLAYEIPRF